jgi:hypothetical protein
MIANFEITDTFGGEANYSWVRRATFQFKSNITEKALIRKAKKWAELSGVRCDVDNYGEMISIKPKDRAWVVFITEGIM